MYLCKKCGKEYDDKYAFLGHCSSHNRKKKEKVEVQKVEKPHICNFCEKEFVSGPLLGNHKRICSKHPLYEERIALRRKSLIGRVSSQETRDKVSIGRIKFLKNNPDKHPWKLNSKFKSVPCELLKDKLRDAGVVFEEEFTPLENRFFAIDIAIVDKKIGIEVNGNQHYNKDGSLCTYYQKRNDLIEAAGWKLLQIHYSKVYDNEFLNGLIVQRIEQMTSNLQI